MFVVPPHVPAIVEHTPEPRWQSSLASSWSKDLLYWDPNRQLVDAFKVGDTTYKPLKPMEASFEPPMYGRPGRFVVPTLSNLFVGRGKTLEEAKEDWTYGIDQSIQRLLSLREFELNDSEREQLSILKRAFDLNEIRYGRPLAVRQYGQVVSIYPRPNRIRWLDGTTSTLRRDQLPAEVIGFRVGQPFDAVVERDARSGLLLKVIAAFPCRPLPAVSEEEAENLLKEVPSSKDRRKLSWD